MQKLCCVRTRQHPLPVWSHKFVISSPTHFSINSQPFLMGIVSNKHATKMATQPGQIVSVDQLESNSPGLIAQLKGKLTQQRYKYDTVFVDQFSGYTFVYLQRRLTSEETVQAKHAFEQASPVIFS